MSLITYLKPFGITLRASLEKSGAGWAVCSNTVAGYSNAFILMFVCMSHVFVCIHSYICKQNTCCSIQAAIHTSRSAHRALACFWGSGSCHDAQQLRYVLFCDSFLHMALCHDDHLQMLMLGNCSKPVFHSSLATSQAACPKFGLMVGSLSKAHNTSFPLPQTS